MVVLIGLLVQGAVERYAVTRACNVAVRYGKRLPEMVLGEFKPVALHHMGRGVGRRAGQPSLYSLGSPILAYME